MNSTPSHPPRNDEVKNRIDLTVAKKNIWKGEAGVVENLYSGTSKRSATQFSSISQRSPQVTSYVTPKT